MQIAVLPGSFDPVTLGHLDVIERAGRVFEEVHVLVVHNPGKTPRFDVDRRVELIRAAIDEAGLEGRFVVDAWSEGLLVDYCRSVGSRILVKGVRSQIDVAYETPMAIVNRGLAGVETVFLLSDPAHAHVSSSLVRQVAALGGDVTPYVPAVVAEAMRA